MIRTLADARDLIRKNDIRMVDMKFSDLWGRWHQVTIPSGQLDEHLMRDGVGFDGSSVGLKSVKSGDMVLLPDFATAFRLASFNVVSIASTTGFASVDFAEWPTFAPIWMIFLSCFVTSSGSTGGGIKMGRIKQH